MTEYILFLVIVALCCLIGWMEYNNRKERKSYLNALLAKNASELVQLDLVDKAQVEVEKPNKLPDLIPESELDDKTWRKHIIKN